MKSLNWAGNKKIKTAALHVWNHDDERFNVKNSESVRNDPSLSTRDSKLLLSNLCSVPGWFVLPDVLCKMFSVGEPHFLVRWKLRPF